MYVGSLCTYPTYGENPDRDRVRGNSTAKLRCKFLDHSADSSDLLHGLQGIAKLTGCTNPDAGKSNEVAMQAVRWLADQARWLLVLDNLDDIGVVKNYLPDTTNGGHTLVTTRNPFTQNILAQGLEVTLLDEQKAIDLLLLRAELDASDDSIWSEASLVVNELGFLPLALEQAASYIREQLKDIFAFRTVYSSHRKQFHSERPEGNWSYHAEVGTTWRLSFDAVEKRNKSAKNLLRLFARWNSFGLPRSWESRTSGATTGNTNYYAGQE